MLERREPTSQRSLLPAIGALIVLTTFVVKDGLRDHYKDLASSVDSALLLYDQGNQIGDVAVQVEGVRNVVERQHTPGSEAYNTFYQKWIEYEGRVDRLKELLAKLHGTQENSNAWKALKEDNDKFQQSVQEYGQRAVADANVSADPLSKESGTIFTKMNDLDKDLRDSATNKVKVSERNASLFGYCSYALYLIGWILGFIAKVRGVPGMDEPG